MGNNSMKNITIFRRNYFVYFRSDILKVRKCYSLLKLVIFIFLFKIYSDKMGKPCMKKRYLEGIILFTFDLIF